MHGAWIPDRIVKVTHSGKEEVDLGKWGREYESLDHLLWHRSMNYQIPALFEVTDSTFRE
jgi:hypothetical protein